MTKRWLPVASLIGAALVVGTAAWLLLGSGGSAESNSTARKVDAGPERATPPPARAGPAETSEESAAAQAPADHARPLEPERVVDRVGDVDVRGWILVSGPDRESRPREEGWVVLQSLERSPVRCRVAAPLHEGRFKARLPGNAIVTADRVELEERPALVASETFDIADSTLLEIHVAWAPPTTLRVLDAASRVELRDVRVADDAGEPIERARLLLRPGEERELTDSPLTLAPPFTRGSLSFQWNERLRVGAPGHATEEIEVTHGHDAEFTVALGPAARLVVTLAPWPPPRSPDPTVAAGDVDVHVWLYHVEPAGSFLDGADNAFTRSDDELSIVSIGFERLRGRGWSVEKRARAPDEQGIVTYEDLSGGSWVASVELATPPGRSVFAHDERLVDVVPGRTTAVTLDLTRPPVALATLLVRAHDAKDGQAIALEKGQVSVRRVDDPDLAIKRSKDGARFDTTSGAVEIVVRALGELVFRPARDVALLVPGENVVDLALERCAAIRLKFRGEKGGGFYATTVAARDGSQRSGISLIHSVALHDARGERVPGPWFTGDECWWLIEPGRYDVALSDQLEWPEDIRRRLRAIDVPQDAVVAIELDLSR